MPALPVDSLRLPRKQYSLHLPDEQYLLHLPREQPNCQLSVACGKGGPARQGGKEVGLGGWMMVMCRTHINGGLRSARGLPPPNMLVIFLGACLWYLSLHDIV